MRAAITVRMDNAAFAEGAATELGRILRDLANQIEAYAPETVTLRDHNGNTVGLFCIEPHWRP